MFDYQVFTKNLNLLPLTPEWLEAMRMGPEKFQSFTGYRLPDPYTEFPEALDQIILHLKTNPSQPPWISYAIIHTKTSTYIGQAGYKGQPNQDGIVEIGYEIARAFRSRGFAHEVIRHLIREAFNRKEVKAILAHTLPQKNPSNHLLIKNKFVFQSRIVDPDDGPVWQWILKRTAYTFSNIQDPLIN